MKFLSTSRNQIFIYLLIQLGKSGLNYWLNYCSAEKKKKKMLSDFVGIKNYKYEEIRDHWYPKEQISC